MQNNRSIVDFSQAIKGKDTSLSTYEKEILALVLAVWTPYLLGQIDHKSLKFLWDQHITNPT